MATLRRKLVARLLGCGLAAAIVAFPASPLSGGARAASVAPVGPGVAAWGSGGSGQLGDGTTTDSPLPMAVSGLSGGVIAVAGGAGHSLALRSDGTVLAWGYNPSGQLGNGTTVDSAVPVTVTGLGGVIAIAGGGYHSLALRSDGSVVAWGANASGQLGNGTTIDSAVPVPVTGLTGVIAISGGFAHSLALRSDGSVVAWGHNQYGQLGNGTTIDSAVPVPVSGVSGVTAIAAGDRHSLALRSDGSVRAWGANNSGQLGDGTTADSPVPVAVTGLSGATAIAGGQYDSLALKPGGSVVAWGFNGSGQLGDGTTGDRSTPVTVAGLSGATAIAGGRYHNLALRADGSVAAWGYNAQGQLGDGVTADSAAPVTVVGLTGVYAIGGGGYHSLAIKVPAVEVLPATSNGAYGGYTTAATVENTGTAPSWVGIAYFDQTGVRVGPGDLTAGLAAGASWTVRQDDGRSFAPGGAGSAIVYSDQPIAAFVNEFAPGNAGDATSYTAIPAGGMAATLYAPAIANDAYGGYTTGIGLLNRGSSSADVTITYRDGSGNPVTTQTVTGLAADAYQAVYSGQPGLLAAGFAGTATITSSAGQPLGAIVNETGPGGQFSSYDAVAAAATSLSAPVALNDAYGGYFTGMGVQNASAAAGTVSITYYDSGGARAGGKSLPIKAGGSVGVYQGSLTEGPPLGAYTAVIQSTLPLAAIVNEVAPAAGAARQSTSYNTFPAGSGILNLPLVENAGTDPWNTGEGIMNTGAASTTVTISYHDAATGAALGGPQPSTLSPNAFLGIYQPASSGGLRPGSRATAVVATAPGGQVAVICNERSPTSFMSYGGQ